MDTKEGYRSKLKKTQLIYIAVKIFVCSIVIIKVQENSILNG